MTSEPTWMASNGPKADHDHTFRCPKKFWMSVKYFMGEDAHNLTQLFPPITMLAEWYKMMMINCGTNSDNIQWPQSKSWMSPSYLGMPQKIVQWPLDVWQGKISWISVVKCYLLFCVFLLSQVKNTYTNMLIYANVTLYSNVRGIECYLSWFSSYSSSFCIFP